jgi:hypothetical protein
MGTIASRNPRRNIKAREHIKPKEIASRMQSTVSKESQPGSLNN